MRTLTTTLLSVAILASNAFATAQYPDKILYDGKKYDLHTNPMDAYFDKNPEKRTKSVSIAISDCSFGKAESPHDDVTYNLAVNPASRLYPFGTDIANKHHHAHRTRISASH